MAFLIALDAALSGSRFPLQGSCLVGRDAYNHIVLDDPHISRQHARIAEEGGGHVLYDLNSANGSWINDEPVRRRRLASEDVVRFGPLMFRYEDSAASVDEAHRKEDFIEPPTMGRGASSVAQLGGDPEARPEIALHDLHDAYHKLRRLYGLLRSLSTAADAKELVARLTDHLLELFPAAERAAVFLPDASGRMAARGLVGRSPALPSALSSTVRFRDTDAHIVCEVAPGSHALKAPMILRGAVQGWLLVEGARFGEADEELLHGVATQAVLALQEALKQERLQEDLLLARQIQRSLLPLKLPSVEGLEFVAEYRPAYSVGGDFYDVFWLSENRIGLFIADVSGKGIAAALLMARLSSDLRVSALAEAEPVRALAQVNLAMLERAQPEIFVTGVYLTFDVYTREILLANAGHPPPFLRRADGTLQRIEEGVSTALGIFEDVEYQQAKFTLAPGDALVLYTDGVVEATDARGRQFGFERLERSLGAGASRAVELAERLLGDLRSHVGEGAQSDDLTLLLCGLTSAPSQPRVTQPNSPIRGRSDGST